MRKYATKCVPAVGYASRGAACIGLKEQGYTWGEVARILGMPSSHAASSLATKTKQRAADSARIIELEGNLFLDLDREAVARGMPANMLAATILRTVVVDRLYSAVLDQ